MQQNKAQQTQSYFAHKYAYGCCHVLVSLYYKSWWIQVIPSVGEVILNGICKIYCHLKATSESANRTHNYFVFAISWYQWNVSATPIQPLQRINLISVVSATDVGIRRQLITKCLDVSIPGTNGQRRNAWYLETATYTIWWKFYEWILLITTTDTPEQYLYLLFKNIYPTAILLITTTNTPVKYLCPLF